MEYVTLSNLTENIRKNIWKIPHDIDFVIGVPRSGMIVASVISSYLNTPLIDINSFLAGVEPAGGGRLVNFKNSHKVSNKALVVEDTVFSGGSLMNAKRKLEEYKKDITFISLCAYLEGYANAGMPDIYLEDIRQESINAWPGHALYEWNIFQHHEGFMKYCLYDIDGVFCLDPPDERRENDYMNYIKNAVPLYTPLTKIGGIITYRLVKNKEITEIWLKNNGIRYGELIMFNAQTWEQRANSGLSPEAYKADFYKQHDNYRLFVESSDYQARRIFELTQKLVYSVEANKIYQV